MPTASILIKPASSGCSMDCAYCFYKVLSSNREEYNKGFMSAETLETLVAQAIDYADGYLAFAFQGGEPMLAGMRFFERVVSLQKELNHKHLTIENTIQTNGIHIDETWARFFAENHFLVGVSLDGPKKVHDRYRKDMRGEPTFVRVMEGIRLLKQHHVDYNILSVITNDSAEKAAYLYKFYKRNHFDFVQLIPCMDGEISSGDGIFAVQAETYGRFLCEIFDLWYEDFFRGQVMDIRMFSNLAQMAAGFPPEECGMCGHCSCYFVVEGDGSVYPCDFYCTDEWKLGVVGDSFAEMAASGLAKRFVEVSLPVAKKCGKCPYVSLCRGGCRRWREPFADTDGLNRLCGAYEVFFEHTWERLQGLGQYIRRKMLGMA